MDGARDEPLLGSGRLDTESSDAKYSCAVRRLARVYLLFPRQHCLYFIPLPHGQGEFLPTFWVDSAWIRFDGTGPRFFSRMRDIMLSAGFPACRAAAISFIGSSM